MLGQNLAIGAVVFLLVVARFLIRELRERRFLIARIYLLPALLGAIALALVVWTLVSYPATTLLLVLASVAALAFGALVGYAVAQRTTVRVTSDPSVLFARGSYATVAIWLGALAIRFAARFAFGTDYRHHLGESLALNAALVVLLASALFFVRYRLLVASRLERARGTSLAEPAL